MSDDLEAGGSSTKDPSAKPGLAELGGGLSIHPTKGRPDVNRIITEEITRGEGPIAVEGMSVPLTFRAR